MRRIIAVAALIAVAICLSVTTNSQASNVGPGSGGCYPWGAKVFQNGYWWICSVDGNWWKIP